MHLLQKQRLRHRYCRICDKNRPWLGYTICFALVLMATFKIVCCWIISYSSITLIFVFQNFDNSPTFIFKWTSFCNFNCIANLALIVFIMSFKAFKCQPLVCYIMRGTLRSTATTVLFILSLPSLPTRTLRTFLSSATILSLLFQPLTNPVIIRFQI